MPKNKHTCEALKEADPQENIIIAKDERWGWCIGFTPPYAISHISFCPFCGEYLPEPKSESLMDFIENVAEENRLRNINTKIHIGADNCWERARTSSRKLQNEPLDS